MALTAIHDGEVKSERYPTGGIDPIAMVIAINENGGFGTTETYHLIVEQNHLPDRDQSWPIVHDHNSAQAMKMRRYYKNKMMRLMMSRSWGMSKFRNDMYSILQRGPLEFVTAEELALLVKIPQFYTEDKALDRIEKRFPKTSNGQSSIVNLESAKLTMFDLTERYSKHEKTKRYWFTDPNGNCISLMIEFNNPLEHLLISTLGKEKELTVTGKAYPSRIIDREIDFYELSEWKVDPWINS